MIELKCITFGYEKNKDIITDLSYEFTNGLYLITGTNGSGKTTLLNLINGILSPDVGSVVIDKNNGVDPFYEVTSVDYQDISFFNSIKVGTFIKIMNDLFPDSKKESEVLIEILQLDLNKKIKDLSKGNKRKLMLFPALLTDKKILVLDEPFDNLDVESIKKICTYLSTLKNKCIILVSHINIDENISLKKLLLKEGKLIKC